MALKLSTGKEAFPIEFDNGDKEVIYFNPNDPDLATRLMAAKEKISERISSMDVNGVELSDEGEPIGVESVKAFWNLPEDEMKKVMDRAEKSAKVFGDTKTIVFEEINAAFGSNVSDVLFKHCSPFSIVNGEYYIMYVLSELAPEIQKRVNKANAETEKKMAKHIGKYLK